MPIRLRLLRERFVVFFGKGSYGRDTLINTLGVLFAAVIPVAVLPILSRLYSPAEFGLFGVFAALVGLGTIASTGRYEAAILLPEEDDAAVSIACAAFLFLTAFVSALAIIFTLAYFIGVGSVRAHSALIGLGVIAVAFSGCVQILLSAAIRKRVFAKVSFARFCAALVSAFLSILIGASTQYAEGLAIGVTAGYAVCALILSRVVARQYGGVSLPDRAAIYGQVKRYRNFPLFSLPSDFSNTLATNLPVLFFSTFFGSAATGSDDVSAHLGWNVHYGNRFGRDIPPASCDGASTNWKLQSNYEGYSSAACSSLCCIVRYPRLVGTEAV